MSTIPISQLANVVPSVLSAGGAGVALNGMFLDNNPRIPSGTVLSFASQPAVQAYFGPGTEATQAGYYFGGYTGATQTPAAMLFTLFQPAGSQAFLRSGNVGATLTLAQLQGLSGSLAVVMDGVSHSAGSLNLSSATSYSSAATLIQTGLNGSLATIASFTAAIAASTFSVTGSIAGNVLTVTAVSAGTIVTGAAITGTGITTTTITGQLSGTTGGIGTYAVATAQAAASTTVSGTYGTMTVSATSSGTIGVGQTVNGGSTTAGTIITALGTGTGGNGTYIVNLTQTVGSTSLTTTGTAVAVSYDSTSGGFVVTSGLTGATSTVAYATGSLSASLLMTSATGATLSQGVAPQTPATFMTGLVSLTQNWASFKLLFDPDTGPAGGTTSKLAFATWNSQQNNSYIYLGWDTDPNPALTLPAVSSFGYLNQQAANSGTAVFNEPTNAGNVSSFVSGAIASINFALKGGRIALAGRSQAGLVADISTLTAATNLGGNPQSAAGGFGNYYNFYGVYGAAAQNFIQLQRGICSGPFSWIDSYVNQIWLNRNLQVALATLFSSVNTVPFNNVGKTQIGQALLPSIQAALSFGMINTNVTLTSSQITAVNNAVGANVASLLASQGWYLNLPIPAPSLRASRGPWPGTLYYVDGGAVQSINLGSVALN